MTAAIPCLEAARQIDPSNYENAYDLALAYLQTGAIAKSREVISALLDWKDRAELHNLLGDVEEAEGHVQDAAKQYEAAAAATSFATERGYYKSKAARTYQSAGDTAKARKLWSELADDPAASMMSEAKVRLGELTVQAAKK